MTPVPLHNHGGAAESPLDPARRVGGPWLEHRVQLAELAADQLLAITDVLERKVTSIVPETYQEPGPAGYPYIPNAGGVFHFTELTELHHPGEYCPVPRALCCAPPTHSYLDADERPLLERGTPVPLVSWPVVIADTARQHDTLSVGHPPIALIEDCALTPSGSLLAAASGSRGLTRLALRPSVGFHGAETRSR